MVARFISALCIIALVFAPVGSAANAAAPAAVTIGTSPQGFTQIGSTIFFAAITQGAGFELWRTNGYGVGTQIVKDIRPGAGSSLVLPPGFTSGFYDPVKLELVELNGLAYFWANDGIHGYELWRTDGTEAGTFLVKDVRSGSASVIPDLASNLPRLYRAKNLIFFVTEDANWARQLWRSDGTSAGTFLLVNNFQGGSVQELNGQIFFSALNGLWKTDGTVANTVLVKNVKVGQLLRVGNWLMFGVTAQDGNSSTLWRSDGTEVGTVEVPGGTVVNECPTTNFLYYGTATLTHYYFSSGCGRLWASNGLTTTLVLTNTSPSPISEVVSHGNLLLLNNSGKLWKSDGTVAGTVQLGPSQPDVGVYSPSFLTIANHQVFFRGSSPNSGVEVWRARGDFSEFDLMRDIFPGVSSSFPLSLGGTDKALYFGASETGFTYEAWRSDGTITGTVKLKDFQWPYQVYLPTVTK